MIVTVALIALSDAVHVSRDRIKNSLLLPTYLPIAKVNDEIPGQGKEIIRLNFMK